MMRKLLGITLLLAVAQTASASLTEACDRTVKAQGNLAAAVKFQDKIFLIKAAAAGDALGYDDAWYNQELTRMRLNAQDQDSMQYIGLEKSPEYKPMYDRYMKTCMTVPSQYLTRLNSLMAKGWVSQGEVAQAEKAGLSNVEGMRPQQGGGLKARAESGRALLEQHKAQ